MQQSVEKFREQGFGVVAISPDTPEILNHFADRAGITFPLLSDKDSKIIKSFGILNTTIPEGQRLYGIPFPGTYVVNDHGKVLSKYFEESYTDRVTANTILIKEFGLEADRKVEVRSEQLKADVFASAYTLSPGNRISIIADIELPDNIHLYAEGAEGYTPVSLNVERGPALSIYEPDYPEAETMFLEVIKEKVPVYKGRIRISRDVTLSPQYRSSDLVVSGSLNYQACDEAFCYLPVSVPLEFNLRVQPLDFERVPAADSHKPAAP